MIKLKDSYGETVGYKLGGWYLMKVYTWGNSYEWALNKTGDSFYYKCEEHTGVDFFRTFKEGKAELIRRQEGA